MAELDSDTFTLTKFITICGMKLQLPSLTLTTSLHLFHRFSREVDWRRSDIDPHLICAASLYLACQIEEEAQVKLRDIINVCYRSLHPDKPALEIADTYWALRESVLHVQMLILRGLRFYVVHDAPHRYLLHYLKSLRDWLWPRRELTSQLCHLAWSHLRDIYMSPAVLKYRPSEIALAVLQRTLEELKIELPLEEKMPSPWWRVFAGKTVPPERISEIVTEIDKIHALDRRVS